jgi:hypothetical protein
MTKVFLDPALRAKLHNLSERLELCDEEGQTVAYVTPVQDRSPYANLQGPFTDEEICRAEQEPGGRTLAEIWADLDQRQ